MIQFYVPDIEADPVLPEEESGHACRVLRMKEGDTLVAVDGKGTRFTCRITSCRPKRTELEILERHPEPKHWNQRITVAVAPPKNMDRMEWLVEKAVEVGIDRIVFILCDRSERKVLKTERLKKIAVSAMKQSLKTYLPEITELVPVRRFLTEEKNGNELRCFGYCSDSVERKEFTGEYDGKRDVSILIGPEGDFSPEEVETAIREGWVPVTFGQSRLRTETAALYGVQAAHILGEIAP